MIINYSSKKLEKILKNERLIKKEYTSFYRKVINRMSELRVANSLSEIPSDPPPRRHKLTGSLDGCWGIDVSKNYRIILQPNGEYNEDNLNTIIEIKIIDIECYH